MAASRREARALTVSVLIVLVLAAWIGGGVTTRLGIWRAPWVAPAGIPLSGEPDTGVAYTVKIWTHCGLRLVEFDDDMWAISGVLSDGRGNPPWGFGNPFDVGTVTLTSPETAIYQSSRGERRDLTRGNGLPAVEGCL